MCAAVRGADAAVQDGATPVFIAACKGHTGTVEALHRLGADIRQPVQACARFSPRTALTVLLQSGMFPLLASFFWKGDKQVDTTKLLIALKADLGAKHQVSGCAPLLPLRSLPRGHAGQDRAAVGGGEGLRRRGGGAQGSRAARPRAARRR